MLSSSYAYQEATNASFREYKALAVMHLTRDTSYPFATAVASSSATGYTPSQACDGRWFLNEHTSAGSYLPNALRGISRGWRGNRVSDANGNINETLTVTYIKPTPMSTVFLYSIMSSVPKSFKIFADGVEIVSVERNTEAMWHFKLGKTLSVTTLKLEITSIANANENVHLIEFGAVRSIILDDENIIDFSFMNETKPVDAGPVGGVSSGELSIALNNEAGWFTQNKAGSLLSEYIGTNVLMRAYIGLAISDTAFEYLPCGEYEVSDWKAPSSKLEATITAYDRLYRIGNYPVPVLPAYSNVSIPTLMITLLTTFGINRNDIIVDPRVSSIVPVGWIPKGTVYDALNEMCIAANATITTTPDFKIRILYNYSNDKPIRDWNDDNQVMDLDNPVTQKDIYDGIKLKYAIPSLSSFTEIVDINDLELLSGVNKFNNIPLASDFPTIDVNKVELINAANARLLNATFGAWECDLSIENLSADDMYATLRVYGVVATLNSYVYRTDNTPGKRLLEVTSNLIQSAQAASMFSKGLLPYVTSQDMVLTGAIRGDLSVELFDTVTVSSEADDMPREDIRLTRISVKYNGGIDVDIEGRKPIVPTEYSYIAPGMVIQTKTKV